MYCRLQDQWPRAQAVYFTNANCIRLLFNFHSLCRVFRFEKLAGVEVDIPTNPMHVSCFSALGLAA